MKDDEIAFLLLCAGNIKPHGTAWPRHIRPSTMHYKRAWYLLLKWSRKGWYDYGVTLDMGWMMDAGLAAAEEIRIQQGGEKCQRCGEDGEDRRTLWMACFYEMGELGIPLEQVAINGHYCEQVGTKPSIVGDLPVFDGVRDGQPRDQGDDE